MIWNTIAAYWLKSINKCLYPGIGYIGILCVLFCSCKPKLYLSPPALGADAMRSVLPTTKATPYVPKQAMDPSSESDALAINTILHAQLNAQSAQKKEANILEGYTLQLYKGFVRQEAERIQQEAQTMGFQVFLRYKQPHYLVGSGFFVSLLDAHAQAYVIKKNPQIKQAIILPTHMRLDKYLAHKSNK